MTDDAVEFEWERGSNRVLDIYQRYGEPAGTSVPQLNAELNNFGAAWIDEEKYIVRTHDGGLAVYY